MFLPAPNGPPLKVGIFRSSSIGDVILATACLDLLSHLRMPIEVTWVGREPSIKLLMRAFPNFTFIECDKTADISKNSKLVEALSKVHFMVDLQRSIQSRMLCYNLKGSHGIPINTASKAQFFRTKLIAEARMFGRNRPLPDRALTPPRQQYQMMCDALDEGLRKQLPPEMTDGLAEFHPKPRLPTGHAEGNLKPWQKELRIGSWLAVVPGASYPTKRAPLHIFANIIREVRSTLEGQGESKPGPIGLLIVGDQDDRKFGLKLLDEIEWEDRFLNLSGKLSLWSTALALKEASILLCNDSGLAHMAEAVGTPVSTLFGPTVEAFGFSPQLEESKAFSIDLGCRPCSKHGKAECRFEDQYCFKGIRETDVAQHISQALMKDLKSENSNTPKEKPQPSDSDQDIHA